MVFLRRRRAGGVGVVPGVAFLGVGPIVGQDVRVLAGYGGPQRSADARMS